MCLGKGSQLVPSKSQCIEGTTLPNHLNGLLLPYTKHECGIIVQYRIIQIVQRTNSHFDFPTLNVLPNFHSGRNRVQVHSRLYSSFVHERLGSFLLSLNHEVIHDQAVEICTVDLALSI